VTDINPRLAADLARIAAKYPPSDWEALLSVLEDPNSRERVAGLLRELAATSRERVRSAPTNAEGVGATIEELRISDPRRAGLLERIWTRLREKKVAPTMAQLRALAGALGIKDDLGSRRAAAVSALVQHLVDMPMDDLERAIALSQNTELGDIGDFQSWFDLILEKGEARGGPSDSSTDR
jgi:hypothetical protein